MATATVDTRDMATFAISIPKIDIKRFKGIIKAMGWTFEKIETMDETEYVMSNPKIMESICEGEAAITAGEFKTTKLEDLWK